MLNTSHGLFYHLILTQKIPLLLLYSYGRLQYYSDVHSIFLTSIGQIHLLHSCWAWACDLLRSIYGQGGRNGMTILNLGLKRFSLSYTSIIIMSRACPCQLLRPRSRFRDRYNKAILVKHNTDQSIPQERQHEPSQDHRTSQLIHIQVT